MPRWRERESVVVTLVLAGAIAAATVLCSLFFTITHDFPPVPHPDRIALIWRHDANMFRQRTPLSLGEFRLLAHSAPAFEATTATSSRQAVTDAPARRTLTLERVADGFASVIQIAPPIGRLFTTAELRAGARVALVSGRIWRDLFGADPRAIGRWLTIDGADYEVVGVMPDRFRFPWAGASVWIPFPADSPPTLTVDVTGRLASGATMSAAAAQFNAAALAVHVGFAGDRTPTVVAPITDEAAIRAGPGLMSLIGPSALILLLTWANAAMLLLIAAASRQRELAVRAALGASRARLLGESLIRTAALTVVAAALGGLGAYWMTALLEHAVATMDPGGAAPSLGGPGIVTIVAAALALLTIPAAGLIPALAAARADLNAVLAGRRPALRLVRRQYGVSDVLLLLQVGFAVVLVLSCAFLLRFVGELRGIELRYDARQVLAVAARQTNLAIPPDALTRIAAQAGVEAAAVADSPPVPFIRGSAVPVSDAAGSRPCVATVIVTTSGIFDVLALQPRGSSSVGSIVASETAVRRCWNGALGDRAFARIAIDKQAPAWLPVSAVVADAYREFAIAGSAPPLYVIVDAIRQRDVTFLIRARDIAVARAAVDRVLPREVAASADTIDAQIRRVTDGPQIFITAFAGLGLLALLIAASGVYAALRHAVAARTTEIGVRRALGSPAHRIVTLVVSHHLPIVLIGLAVGLAGTILVTNVMWREVLVLSGTDPWTTIGVIAILLVAAAGASIGPVTRAIRTNPADVLRAL